MANLSILVKGLADSNTMLLQRASNFIMSRAVDNNAYKEIYKVGNRSLSARFKLPESQVVHDTLTYNPADNHDYIERFEEFNIDQSKSIDLNFTSEQMVEGTSNTEVSLKRLLGDGFNGGGSLGPVLKRSMKILGKTVDSWCVNELKYSSYKYIGNATKKTLLSAAGLNTALEFDNYSGFNDGGRSVFLPGISTTFLYETMTSEFVAKDNLSIRQKQFESYSMSNFLGMRGETEFVKLYNNVIHTSGTVSADANNGSITVQNVSFDINTDETTLTLEGFATASGGTVLKGDIGTISGIGLTSVNPAGSQTDSTGFFPTFVVAEDATPVSGGTVSVKLKGNYTPFVSNNPSNGWAKVNRAIVPTDVVRFEPSHLCGFIVHSDCFKLMFADLQELSDKTCRSVRDPLTGVMLRVINGSLPDFNTVVTKADIFFGGGVLSDHVTRLVMPLDTIGGYLGDTNDSDTAQKVFVVNSTAEALPTKEVGTANVAVQGTANVAVQGTANVAVQGTADVAVQGTADVAVQGAVALAEGTESIGTIEVSNTEKNPVNTKVVTTAAKN